MARVGGRPRLSTPGQSEEDSDLFVRALARGLMILALFDVEHPHWSLSEICAHTGISKTTAYRLLRTMEAKDFVAFDPETELYHLGRATIPGAYLALSYIGFVRAVHPFLEELAEATGETVELTVEGAGGAVVVDQVATTHPFKPNLPIGRILCSMANSSLRMHVAFRPETERQKILRSAQLRLTPHTVTDPEEIAHQLAAALRDGVSYDIEEQDLGVCAVSAPVFGADGAVRAVVTVVAPSERFGSRDKRKNTEAVRSTATEMTRYLSRRATPAS
jgi:IclR family transcriptional regulator, pca regulon regulatory protein